MKSTLFIFAALLSLAAALPNSYTPPKTHRVQVGGKNADGTAQLIYKPAVIYANPGDVVIYDFRFANHTLTQSSFEKPCTSSGGIKSGFLDNLKDIPGKKQFRVTVKDRKPVWFYCGQGNHCKQGMVHAINPPKKGNTFEKFLRKAKATSPPPPPPPTHYQPKPNPYKPKPKKFTVRVGKGKTLRFIDIATDLSFIKAKAGDTIDFIFTRGAHGVVQSSFDSPCSPLDASGIAHSKSGFVTLGNQPPYGKKVKVGEEFVQTYTIPHGYDGKTPLWFYCPVADHCQKKMVFAINPTGFEDFVENASSSQMYY